MSKKEPNSKLKVQWEFYHLGIYLNGVIFDKSKANIEKISPWLHRKWQWNGYKVGEFGSTLSFRIE